MVPFLIALSVAPLVASNTPIRADSTPAGDSIAEGSLISEIQLAGTNTAARPQVDLFEYSKWHMAGQCIEHRIALP